MLHVLLETCVLTWQGLRQLDLANVMGCLPTECDSFLKSLTKLTSLRLHNESVAAKMPPMHCLSELTSLQVRACASFGFSALAHWHSGCLLELR